jgi:hypothetical protein
MEVSRIVAGIDEEIQKLKQARALLAGRDDRIATARGPQKKHVMSAEARKRIGDAQRRRWTAQKKKAGK